jgi:hypothetical protein
LDDSRSIKILPAAGKWETIDGMPWECRERSAPKPSKNYVLAEAGKMFIRKGRATSVTAAKPACL